MIRNSKGQFIKGHPCLLGSEKGWFKKGIIPKTAFKKGHNINQNRVITKKHRENLRKSHLGQKAWNKGLRGIGGKDHYNWKGGITNLTVKIRNCFKYRQWRSDIFHRDDFTCQRCSKKGGKLNAHHIKPFYLIIQYYEITNLQQAIDCEELWDINNGVTLCKECHDSEVWVVVANNGGTIT